MEENKTNDGRFHYDPDTNYDEATMAQQRRIEEEIAGAQPLIGQLEPLDTLLEEYKEEQDVFHHKIEKLKEKYRCIRRIRGDGNCFYRGFGYACMSKFLKNKEELRSFKSAIDKGKDGLIELGFPSYTIEDFHSVFVEVLEKLESGCDDTEVYKTCNDQGYSDYHVVFLRLMVSGYLQKEHEFFSDFVEGGRTVKEFCSQEVEPMGKESDHIHIIALTRHTGIPVRIEYLDQSGDGSIINSHTFPDGSDPQISFLYKPGHYDLLYA